MIKRGIFDQQFIVIAPSDQFLSHFRESCIGNLCQKEIDSFLWSWESKVVGAKYSWQFLWKSLWRCSCSCLWKCLLKFQSCFLSRSARESAHNSSGRRWACKYRVIFLMSLCVYVSVSLCFCVCVCVFMCVCTSSVCVARRGNYLDLNPW